VKPYPKPVVPAAPLTPDFDSYLYATVWGWSIAKDRRTQRWCVRTPAGQVHATAATWRRALDHALEQRERE
jgi:hypothetical protein